MHQVPYPERKYFNFTLIVHLKKNRFLSYSKRKQAFLLTKTFRNCPYHQPLDQKRSGSSKIKYFVE